MTQILLFYTFFLFLYAQAVPLKNIYFVNPFSPEDKNDGMFVEGNGWDIARKAALKFGYNLTSKPVPSNNKKNIYALVYFDALDGHLKQVKSAYPKAKIVTFLWEPPATRPENYNPQVQQYADIILTWHDGLIDGKKYHKFLYAQLKPYTEVMVPFREKKLCCVMAGNKRSYHPEELYSTRCKTIAFFEEHAPEKLDLYGPGWNKQQHKTYKGFAPDKFGTLSKYAFCICYENIKNIPGYISEKIQHCLRANCVPVYWGAPNITDYIPESCFIDRRKFASDKEMYDYLMAMSEQEYQSYLDTINAYLKTTKALLFSPLYFADCILKAIIPEYDRTKAFNQSELALLQSIDTQKVWRH